MKKCSSCHIDKPLDQFGKNSQAKDGLDYYCKSCKRDRYLAKRDASLERAKENYLANRASILEYKRIRYAMNPDAKRAYDKEYYLNNRDALRAQQREWAAENPNSGRERAQKRRALIASVTVDMPTNYWQILLELFGPFCMNPDCDGSDSVLTHDHIIPLSKGGEHSLANSQILCKTCNCRKATQIIDYRKLEIP